MLLSTVNLVSITRPDKYYKKGIKNNGFENNENKVKYTDYDQNVSLKQNKCRCQEADQIPITITGEDDISDDGEIIPAHYCSSENMSSQNEEAESLRDLDNVSLATPDGYNIYLDPTQCSVALKIQSQRTCYSIFKQVTLSCEEKENGTVKLVAFNLESDSKYYLTTNKNRSLEIQMYQYSRPHLENPDERCFLLHGLSTGMVFIQPYHHRGYYIHHIDDEISVRKLEINYRPPEEFYFQIMPGTTLKEPERYFTFDDTIVASHKADLGCVQEPEVNSDPGAEQSCGHEQNVNSGNDNWLECNQRDLTHDIHDGPKVEFIVEQCGNITVKDLCSNLDNNKNANDEQENDNLLIRIRRKGSKKVKLSKGNSFCSSLIIGSCFSFTKKN